MPLLPCLAFFPPQRGEVLLLATSGGVVEASKKFNFSAESAGRIQEAGGRRQEAEGSASSVVGYLSPVRMSALVISGPLPVAPV